MGAGGLAVHWLGAGSVGVSDDVVTGGAGRLAVLLARGRAPRCALMTSSAEGIGGVEVPLAGDVLDSWLLGTGLPAGIR